MASFDAHVFSSPLTSPSSFFALTADKFVLGGPYAAPKVVAAEKLTSTTVRIDFDSPLVSQAAATVAGNYTITGPSVVTVASVAFTPGNSFVVLTVSGTFAPGTYTVTVAASTVASLAGNNTQTAGGSCSLVVDSVALLFSAKMVNGQVRVDFGQALRSLAATTVPGNYTFSGPSALTVASVAFTPGNSFVLLTVNQPFAIGQYTLTVAANTVEMQGFDVFNLSGTSTFEIDMVPEVVAARQVSPTTIRVDFNQPLHSYAATSVAGNYSISGPSSITVSSVAFTPGNSYVVLTVIGTLAQGSYTVSVLANTAQSAADTGLVSDAGSATFTPSDTVAPVVSNLLPAPGSPLSPNQPIGFDVTDASGNLTRSAVYVYYPTLQLFEVLWFGAISGTWGGRAEGFGPKYSGTRSTITNGFRFSGVLRVGGWPAPPVLVADPIDDAGNEAA